jgi:hypothetical protein
VQFELNHVVYITLQELEVVLIDHLIPHFRIGKAYEQPVARGSDPQRAGPTPGTSARPAPVVGWPSGSGVLWSAVAVRGGGRGKG